MNYWINKSKPNYLFYFAKKFIFMFLIKENENKNNYSIFTYIRWTQSDIVYASHIVVKFISTPRSTHYVESFAFFALSKELSSNILIMLIDNQYLTWPLENKETSIKLDFEIKYFTILI